MKLRDIIITEDAFSFGHSIKNSIIEKVDVQVFGHFGDATIFRIYVTSGILGSVNNTGNLGYVIRAFAQLFDLSEDSGRLLSQYKNIPCRMVYNGCGILVGIGHFMEDKFVRVDDLFRVDEK